MFRLKQPSTLGSRMTFSFAVGGCLMLSILNSAAAEVKYYGNNYRTSDMMSCSPNAIVNGSIGPCVMLQLRSQQVPQALKCSFRCVMESSGLMDGAGNFDETNIKSFLKVIPESFVRKNLLKNYKSAVTAVSGNSCDKAYGFILNLFEKLLEDDIVKDIVKVYMQLILSFMPSAF